MLQHLPSDMLAYYEACNIKPRSIPYTGAQAKHETRNMHDKANCNKIRPDGVEVNEGDRLRQSICNTDLPFAFSSNVTLFTTRTNGHKPFGTVNPRKVDNFEDSAGTPLPRPVVDVEAGLQALTVDPRVSSWLTV
eukprot:6485601-Amphidinium_carterae.1